MLRPTIAAAILAGCLAASTAIAVEVTDLAVGAGAAAAPGKHLTLHYVGHLVDGTRFDASHDKGRPFRFKLGAGTVIPGWETGLVGMRQGGKRRLVVPPAEAYGQRAVGGVIPPNSTLIFEIELLKVE